VTPRRAALLALGLAATLAGCRGADARPPGRAPSASEGEDAAAAPVAAVGEAKITKGDLADFFYARFREQWFEAVDEMVDERVLAAERDRWGLAVPDAALDAAVEAEARAREEALKARFGDGADLAASVRERYGSTVEAWKRDVLRPRLATHLLLERAVRLSRRTRDQVSARAIVVRDERKARALREKLDRGADFSLTALEESEDASRTAGGVLPPIARGDLVFPDVEAALFAAPLGTVVGPLEVAASGGREWHLYKVVERTAAWGGDPATLRSRLEADLAASPVTRSEYDRWATRVRRRFGVRTFAPDGSPLRVPGDAR
jgi:hypothetical protein